MPRYVAFLRAINVGGHIVKMDHLRLLFQSFGLSSVETFIQSGNVVFETPKRNIGLLEKMIEERLSEELGYRVATFLRTGPELLELVRSEPFGRGEPANGSTLFVSFTQTPLGPAIRKALNELTTPNDQILFENREVFWLRRERTAESAEFAKLFAKKLGEATTRNMTTVRKIAEKYC
jgi:uncharacterized protein (DUF1697 family)